MADQNQQKKGSSRRRRRQNAKSKQTKPVDLWRPVPPLRRGPSDHARQ